MVTAEISLLKGAMSALGHKRTLAVQNATSALPQERTFAAHNPMSAKCQKRTLIGGLRRCQLPYWATNPPSIEIFAPVKKDARLEQSQTMSSATSSGVPIRPMG